MIFPARTGRWRAVVFDEVQIVGPGLHPVRGIHAVLVREMRDLENGMLGTLYSDLFARDGSQMNLAHRLC